MRRSWRNKGSIRPAAFQCTRDSKWREQLDATPDKQQMNCNTLLFHKGTSTNNRHYNPKSLELNRRFENLGLDPLSSHPLVRTRASRFLQQGTQISICHALFLSVIFHGEGTTPHGFSLLFLALI